MSEISGGGPGSEFNAEIYGGSPTSVEAPPPGRPGAFYRSTVYVLRPPTKTNRAGETVLDYTGLEDADGIPRDRVQVRPVSSLEQPAEDRIAGTQDWIIQTEPGDGDWDVLDTDWLRLPDDVVVAVQGPALRPLKPEDGTLSHVQLRARRVAG